MWFWFVAKCTHLNLTVGDPLCLDWVLGGWYAETAGGDEERERALCS